jgi:hypothetical protein
MFCVVDTLKHTGQYLNWGNSEDSLLFIILIESLAFLRLQYIEGVD